MRKVLLAILLLSPVLAGAEKPALNPSDYAIVVHVQSSRLVDICNAGTCVWVQKLAVVIDGKKYEIRDPAARVDLLRTGDYKAKMLKEETTRPYEYQRTYQFMFVDGKTRRYEVVGEMD